MYYIIYNNKTNKYAGKYSYTWHARYSGHLFLDLEDCIAAKSFFRKNAVNHILMKMALDARVKDDLVDLSVLTYKIFKSKDDPNGRFTYEKIDDTPVYWYLDQILPKKPI